MTRFGKGLLEVESKPSMKALAPNEERQKPESRAWNCDIRLIVPSLSVRFAQLTALPVSQAIRVLLEKKLHCILRLDNFRAGCFLHTGTQCCLALLSLL